MGLFASTAASIVEVKVERMLRSKWWFIFVINDCQNGGGSSCKDARNASPSVQNEGPQSAS